MKNFYHQNEIKIVEIEDYKTYDFQISVPSVYGFNYYIELDKIFENLLNSTPISEEPTCFRLRIDSSFLENTTKDEREDFYLSMINIFVTHITTREKLDREQRLAPPKSLMYTNLTFLNKKSMVNNKLLYPIFRIEIIDQDDSILFEGM
jgi:hypothetical protein